MKLAEKVMGLEGASLTVGGYYAIVSGSEVSGVQLWVQHPSGVDVLVVLPPRAASALALLLIREATEAIGHIGGDVGPKGGVQ